MPLEDVWSGVTHYIEQLMLLHVAESTTSSGTRGATCKTLRSVFSIMLSGNFGSTKRRRNNLIPEQNWIGYLGEISYIGGGTPKQGEGVLILGPLNRDPWRGGSRC